MRTKNFLGCVAAIFVATCLISQLPAADDAWKLPDIPEPQIPDHTFNITEFGANGDGKTSNTKAFASAIEACAKAGGGTVVVPEGTFFTGPIDLVSNMELRVEAGATILFSDNKDDYPLGSFKPLPTR